MSHPDAYHGPGARRPYFEGWYYKLVNSTGSRTLALIPGIHLGREKAHSHSFLQVLDGQGLRCSYSRLSPESFSFREPFSIQVGENRFSREGISVDVSTSELSLRGQLFFDEMRRWPDSPLSPGSMGFLNHIPGLQCYSQVCAMDFPLKGTLALDGASIDFTGGRGYIEKNWGRAFPQAWVWIQSNHFKQIPASLSCSIGDVPVGPLSFRGFLIGLLVGDRFYSFTTQNGSRLQIRSENNDRVVVVSNRHHLLEVRTFSREDAFILCRAPKAGEMIPMVEENLQGRVSVRLIERRSGRVLFEDEGLCAGIEYGGNAMVMIDSKSL